MVIVILWACQTGTSRLLQLLSPEKINKDPASSVPEKFESYYKQGDTDQGGGQGFVFPIAVFMYVVIGFGGYPDKDIDQHIPAGYAFVFGSAF